MSVPGSRRASPIEVLFQLSVIGLVASGFFALAGSGQLDPPTVILVLAGLLVRIAIVAGVIRPRFSTGIIAAIAIGYIGLYALDVFFLSHNAFAATVHGVCFIALLKIITAQQDRDYLYVGLIAFLELLTAALISVRSTFFPSLALFVFFSIAAFISAELRAGLRRFQEGAGDNARLAFRVADVACIAAVLTLVITGGLFLLIPRTARAAAAWFPGGSPGVFSIANRIDLGRFGDIVKDQRTVMRVQPYSGTMPPNSKFRGSALTLFDGRQWTEPPLPAVSEQRIRGTIITADRWQRSRMDGSRFVYRVDLVNAGSGVLFIAGIPEFLNIDAPRVALTPEGSFRALSVPPQDPLRYEVSAHTGPPLDYDLLPSERWRYLDLPPIDRRIRALAREWAGEGSDMARARRIESHLRSEFKYTLDTPRFPAADPLADFLFVRRAGYCEYFASAMAVMLRTIGIPSRVATGFQSGYFNEVSGVYVIRASDAHAWVEAWMQDRGWRTFDPTPADTSSQSGLFSRLGMYLDAADSKWQQWVVSYDFLHQIELAGNLETALRRWIQGGQFGTEHWSAADMRKAIAWALRGLAIAIFIAVLVVFGPRISRDIQRWRRVRRIAKTGGDPEDARILYENMLDLLAQRGYHKPAWFTPAEFAGGLPAPLHGEVVRFTALYNEARFGRDASLNARMTEMLDEFAQSPGK